MALFISHLNNHRIENTINIQSFHPTPHTQGKMPVSYSILGSEVTVTFGK